MKNPLRLIAALALMAGDMFRPSAARRSRYSRSRKNRHGRGKRLGWRVCWENGVADELRAMISRLPRDQWKELHLPRLSHHEHLLDVGFGRQYAPKETALQIFHVMTSEPPKFVPPKEVLRRYVGIWERRAQEEEERLAKMAMVRST